MYMVKVLYKELLELNNKITNNLKMSRGFEQIFLNKDNWQKTNKYMKRYTSLVFREMHISARMR